MLRVPNSETRSIYLNSVCAKFCCLAFTKIYVKTDLHSSELFSKPLHVFRKDRSDRIGDDVLIVISVAFQPYLLEITNPAKVEFIDPEIKNDSANIFLNRFLNSP